MTEQRAVRLYEWVRSGMACVNEEMNAIPWCEQEYFVLDSDYDALSTELAEAKAEIERMREQLAEALLHSVGYKGELGLCCEQLAKVASFPLNEFQYKDRDDAPVYGFNGWLLTVGDIKLAKAHMSRYRLEQTALIPAKGKGE